MARRAPFSPMSRQQESDIASLPLRAALGSAMVYHGASKLSSRGAEEAGRFFEQVAIKPGKPWAVATGIAETLAGVLTVLGVGTRIAALTILGTQAVAVAKVHAPKGFSFMKGGFEYNATLMALALGLLAVGPGEISVYGLVGRRSALRRRWLRSATRRPWLGKLVLALR